MQILIHAGDDLPIYRQIANQITDGIGDGRLGDGERLASHRELAEQLVIAPLTVKKAYDTLEAEGLIRSVRGSGTFVSARTVAVPDGWQARLRPASRRLLAQAELAGVSFTKLVELLRAEKNEIREERASRAPHNNRPTRNET